MGQKKFVGSLLTPYNTCIKSYFYPLDLTSQRTKLKNCLTVCMRLYAEKSQLKKKISFMPCLTTQSIKKTAPKIKQKPKASLSSTHDRILPKTSNFQ